VLLLTIRRLAALVLSCHSPADVVFSAWSQVGAVSSALSNSVDNPTFL
jgi:hypothetical protein